MTATSKDWSNHVEGQLAERERMRSTSEKDWSNHPCHECGTCFRLSPTQLYWYCPRCSPTGFIHIPRPDDES